jgi:prepilin-type N-terminal cleavage/methylation domain-containing protein
MIHPVKSGSRAGGGFALVEILVVMVIIVVLAAVYFGVRGKPKEVEPAFEGEAQSTLGKSIQKAESVECRSNLNQLRQMIEMATASSVDGASPPSLDPGWNLPMKCPVSGYEYRYDPQSGHVWCPTPGHEGF